MSTLSLIGAGGLAFGSGGVAFGVAASYAAYETAPPVVYNDAHAAAFMAAVPTITDPAQQQAVHKFCALSKELGAWAAEVAIWPILGGTAAAHALNLKDLNSYALTIYNSPMHSFTQGIVWNGISQWANTHLVPATALTLAGGASLHWYTTTAGTAGGNNYDLGAVSAGNENLFGASRNTSSGGGITEAMYGKAYQTDAFNAVANPGLGLHALYRSPVGGGTPGEQMVTLARNGQVVLLNGQDVGGGLPTEELALGVVKVPGGTFGNTPRAGAWYSVGAVPQAIQAEYAALILELKTAFGQAV
jgi:hypothetical protein